MQYDQIKKVSFLELTTFADLTFDPVAKEKSIRWQIRQYDKVIQENLEETLPGLIEKVLGIHIMQAEELRSITSR